MTADTLADTLLSAPNRQLVREWSDPAALAHAGWFEGTPPALLDAALRSTEGRRWLSRRLRGQVPLPPRWRAADGTRMRWALGSLPQVSAAVDHAGWLLLSAGVVRVVARHAIENLIAVVGRERYEQSFEAPLSLWRTEPPGDLPDIGAAASDSTEAVASALHTAGWCGINNALAGELASFRGRLHLLAGPHCATLFDRPHWQIDGAGLIEQLASAQVEVWH